MLRIYQKYVFITFFINLFNTIIADEICVKKGPCRCLFSNGTGYDLTPSAARPSFFEAQQYSVSSNGSEYQLHTFYYHPCNDIAPNFPPIPTGKSSCVSNLSVSNFFKL